MKKSAIIDGNEACALIAYKLSEVIAIYPITPSSNMGELADQWMSEGHKNLWGTIPQVIEMQSEAGAAGTVHGALAAGALSTTFTASQGLLLMIPNMYKIAGEMMPTVFHVAARSLATSGLSIFGDHSDVMSTRHTGMAMLASNSVQEAHDMALIAHLAALRSSIPFLHFFDGFRTSHEVSKINIIPDDIINQLVNFEDIKRHRQQALTPDNPRISGVAMNPDVYFQARERANPVYQELPDVVAQIMQDFAKLTQRSYAPMEYYGDASAQHIIVIMGSGADTVRETIDYLNSQNNEKFGVVSIHLFRPFSIKHLLAVIPTTVKHIAVLDRTKEPGSTGEPLYQDVLTAFVEGIQLKIWNRPLPRITGGRYGLSSKEFTPSMIKSIYDHLKTNDGKIHFTIGINDDVSHSSLAFDQKYNIEAHDNFRGIFWGLGADGTVSANKNSIKIIGEETNNWAQGYFVYDSKKSGSKTTSHLRFGPRPIRSAYLIQKANFIACHQFQFLEKYNCLENVGEGAIFLLNAPFEKDNVWEQIPKNVQENIVKYKLRLFCIDAKKVARAQGMGSIINTIMQTCFFAISGILPKPEAIAKIKKSIEKSFGKKGQAIIDKNFQAVDATLQNLYEIEYPSLFNGPPNAELIIPEDAPDFIHAFTKQLILDKGDAIPVSLLPLYGQYPTGTTKYEKRNVTDFIPVWDTQTCIQCGKCSFVCPHSAIRIKAYNQELLSKAPSTYKHTKAKGSEYDENTMYTIQIAPEDCTGCELCIEVCPAKNKSQTGLKAINMASVKPIQKTEKENWDFFLTISEFDRTKIKKNTVKGSQLLEPLFEFSGACAGCGETPYIKLATQLFGDRMLIANATGCSSIYGGNLPTTPYSKNREGRGPAWSNSLFEDNAEYGLGMRLAVEKKLEEAQELLAKLTKTLGREFVEKILHNPQINEPEIEQQRHYIEQLKTQLIKMENDRHAIMLLTLCDYLVKKSVWIFGGDGWAYDIGFGGLDHVIASGKNVNILVMDTEVYSNTGGQMSKATPTGAIAKFASSGKELNKKDLALHAVNYGHVYVAKIAFGANDAHTLKVLQEAENYNGPSLIIAYSPCIAHGYNLKYGVQQQKNAVESGHWHLFRYHPMENNNSVFHLDSVAPKRKISDFMNVEARFNMLKMIDPQRAEKLTHISQQSATRKFEQYEKLAQLYKEEEKKEHKE